jgi:hypothetical protein
MRHPLVTAAAALAALSALGACKRGESLSARDSTFVATMIELRRLPAGAANDSSARRAVLQRHRMTAQTLEAVATALAADPGRAALVWRRIEQAAPAANVPVAPVAPTLPRPAAAGTKR